MRGIFVNVTAKTEKKRMQLNDTRISEHKYA